MPDAETVQKSLNPNWQLQDVYFYVVFTIKYPLSTYPLHTLSTKCHTISATNNRKRGVMKL